MSRSTSTEEEEEEVFARGRLRENISNRAPRIWAGAYNMQGVCFRKGENKSNTRYEVI